MKIVIQRCLRASVSIDSKVKDAIGVGLMILVGVEVGDTKADADYLATKTSALRIFPDEVGVMNMPITTVPGAEVLAISQFTLLASTRKGNRPSYIQAARGDEANGLYEYFCERLHELTGLRVATGVFGADMQVELINDGPVTIIMDTKELRSKN